MPATTLASAPDFAAGTAGRGAGKHAPRPIVPTCSADRPRAANGVKSLATQKDLPMSDYVPGLYNTSWSDNVNGNLVGLTNVEVPRDGGVVAGKPTLLIWKTTPRRRRCRRPTSRPTPTSTSTAAAMRSSTASSSAAR